MDHVCGRGLPTWQKRLLESLVSCLRMSTADKRIDLVQSHGSALSADSRHVLRLPRRSMSAGRSQKGLFFDFFLC